jgi:hypothetical protein
MISNANPWDNLKFDLEAQKFVENSSELYIIPILSLAYMPILMDSNTMKPKFQ